MSTEKTLQVPEVHCDHCKTSLEGAVGELEGVSRVEVSVPEATIDVAFDEAAVSLESIKTTIEEQGYAVFG
ncbi:MAG TPA: copper ion binding protein [Acidimicrobiia bacterium]|nr:copper ion binding protein [Acidimicrobiia bacterium]